MSHSNIDILNAWKLVESLNLKDIPSTISPNKYPAIDLSHETKSNSKKVETKLNYYYIIYFLPFYKGEFLSYFRSLNNFADEIYDYSTDESFLISIEVDETKKLIQDSLYIPDYTVLLYDEKMSINSLENKKNELVKNIISIFEFYKDKELSEVDLKKINNSFLNIFRPILKNFKFLDNFYIQKRIIPKNDDLRKEMNMNSFYLKDLEKIIKNGSTDPLITQYIKGYSKVQENIDENRELISLIIEPKNIPVGKWPSPVKFQLSLMQSVAVNVVVNDILLTDKLTFSSVNGPPGTGKTTLLKDIFANIFIERAKIMSTFSDPQDAFSSKPYGFLEIGKTRLYFNELNEKLKGFEIVVASSNNGAVENISKELPQLNQISRNISEEFNDLENEYENKYKEMISELDLYSEVSEDILEIKDKKSWGIFSVPLGRTSNIADIFESLIFGKKINDERKISIFKKMAEFEETAKNNWNIVIKEFNNKLSEIEKIKNDLQAICDFNKAILSSENSFADNYKNKLNDILLKEKNLKNIDIEISNYPKQNFFLKLVYKFFNIVPKELSALYNKKDILLKERKILEIDCNKLKNNYEKREKELSKLREKAQAIQAIYLKYNKLLIPDNEFWKKDNYEKRQQNTPWLTAKLEGARGELFILALKIHKYFNSINHKKLRNQFNIINYRKNLDLNIPEQKQALKEAWHSIHLLLPVISTTFASLSSMYYGIEDKIIGYLIIDEAGQASPQQAVGAVWRSNHVICVGDPLQIEPVVTTDMALLNDIGNKFNIPKENRDIYFGESASVQQLADLASKYGTYKEKKWIGIPLWVHRRCLNPMFSISNEIAYNNKMVLANNKQGKGMWLDSSGKVSGRQYIKEQGDLLFEKILFHWKSSLEEEKIPNVYIITPFTDIRDNLKKLFKEKLVEQFQNKENIINKWIKTSIGTVHTFQGKEADIVYFVCGTDITTDGAANWSCSKPNILNVAVTRAKKEFYIIGDSKRFQSKNYYSNIFETLKN